MLSALFRGKVVRAATAAATALVFALVLLMPSGTANALNLSEEKEIGRKILEQIRRYMPLVEDGEMLTYIRGVGNRIVKEVGVTPYQYQFFIVDLPVPNAFAIPGGYIFIFRGLIEMMSSEGELASIFSHELAHIQARHIHRKIDDSKVLSVASVAGMVAGILLGGSGAGPALAAGSMAAGQTAALAYSRDHEMEADQLGFRYFCAAGYDPSDMASIMRKMDQNKWSGVSKIPTYLLTHPALGERVLYLTEMAKKENASSPKARKAAVGDFPLLQAALIADHSDHAKAFAHFQPGLKTGDKAAIFGMGRFYLRQGLNKEAAAQLQAAARVIQSPFVLSSLGAAYHRLGKLDEAKRSFESALFLDPSASIVHYRLALVLQDMGQKGEALDHLTRIEDLAPMFPEVDYQLGVLLGQMNRLGMAHYHLGRYYANKLKWDLAIMHYKKAKGFTLDSPNKTEEVNLVLKDLEKLKKDSPVKR
ncbi:MAG: M48 family metalloprotease [Syntrophobacteraceae bacterium]